MRFPRTLSTALVFLALMIPLGFPGMGLVGLFVVGVRRKRPQGRSGSRCLVVGTGYDVTWLRRSSGDRCHSSRNIDRDGDRIDHQFYAHHNIRANG